MIKLPTPLITYPDILNFLPQRKPMVMVDTYYGLIDEEAYTSFYITNDNILLDGINFTEIGIMDFLAQSGIVQMGNMIKHTDFQNESKIAVISQFKEFKFYNNAKIEETIYGKIKKIYSNSYLAILKAVAFTETTLLMEGYIHALLVNNNQNVIR
jgi:3-hydroxymyristoyl/3-hydroxydecanoyl-(acyl carrier protein) dehydratase